LVFWIIKPKGGVHKLFAIAVRMTDSVFQTAVSEVATARGILHHVLSPSTLLRIVSSSIRQIFRFC